MRDYMIQKSKQLRTQIRSRDLVSQEQPIEQCRLKLPRPSDRHSEADIITGSARHQKICSQTVHNVGHGTCIYIHMQINRSGATAGKQPKQSSQKRFIQYIYILHTCMQLCRMTHWESPCAISSIQKKDSKIALRSSTTRSFRFLIRFPYTQ